LRRFDGNGRRRGCADYGQYLRSRCLWIPLQGHEGRQEGLREGMLTILSRIITQRFGALPGWAIVRLAAMPVSELEVLDERLLDAPSVEELLR
jgi:hypothetical protein